MGLKIDSSFVDAQLFKMGVAIENITSFIVVSNLVVNQPMERKELAACIAKVAYVEETKWTMVIAKNVR